MAIDLFSIPVKSLFLATSIDPARSMSCIQHSDVGGVLVVAGQTVGGEGGEAGGWTRKGKAGGGGGGGGVEGGYVGVEGDCRTLEFELF